jgi:hypothetical protein
MAQKSSKSQRSQRALWFISLLVVVSMGLSMIVSFVPRQPRVTSTPIPSPTPFPTRTPTQSPG